jgi:hypothetical protein
MWRRKYHRNQLIEKIAESVAADGNNNLAAAISVMTKNANGSQLFSNGGKPK